MPHPARHRIVNRSTTPAPATAVRVHESAGARVQSHGVRVSSPSDPAEREAESTARRIVRMPPPAERTLRLAGLASGVSRKTAAEEERERQKTGGKGPPMVSRHVARFADALPRVARKVEGQPDTGSNVAAELTASLSSGSPLPLGVRRFMEPRFGADFSGVRVHSGQQAAGLTRQFSAQAFAYGNHIFFGKDRFRPETDDGRELVAHELTHTIQQGAVVQRSPEPAVVSERAAPQVQRLGIGDALDYFADKANIIPGFRMFTIVLGVNPINMSRVERSAANVMRAIVEFIPGGGLVTQALDNYGVFDKVGNWVEQQIRTLGMTGAAIKAAVMAFLDSLGWRDIFDLGGVWTRAKRIFTEPIDRIISFARGLIAGILRFIREAVLRPLAALAQGTRGYDLLKAVLGEDPVTGDPYPRNADTLIGGFMTLIGQEEIWQNIRKSGAVARCWAWFQGALGTVLGFVRQIPQLLIQALQSLELADLVLVPRAFAKVARVFGAFVGNFISWAGAAVWNLLEIVFSVVAPGVMPYLRRAAGAFRTILNNPIGFVGNLVRAAKAGFNQFARNILTHLKTSLIQWLTGALGGLALYIPQSFEIREIVKFVLSVLGLTWANIRQKLVRAIGETAVQALETGFDIVKTLVTQGPAAAWEKIKEQLTNLKELIVEEIMNFVVVKVVQSAIVKLVSMLNPAGAFIQAIIATYNTVMFFIERLRQIIQVATAFLDSISAIASGVIAAAANKVESTLAGLLTLAISFLARLVGLGRVSDVVVNIVNKIRAPIDRALDKVVDWIVAGARKLGRLIAGAVSGPAPAAATAGPQAGPGRLPPIVVPFSMGAASHSLTIREAAGGVELLMASKAELPLTTKFASFYTELDDWRHYLESIRPGVPPYVQREIDAKLNHLRNIRQTQVNGYNEIYTRTFGSRRGDVGHETPSREREAVRALTERATADLEVIRNWAATTGVEDLSPDAIRTRLRTVGTAAFRQAVEARRLAVAAVLSRFQTANGKAVRYRGSLEAGIRGPHKGGVRFNPDDFDLDLFVVDAALHAAVLSGRPAFVTEFTGRPIPARRAGGAIANLEAQVVAALEAPNAVPGLRRGANYILLRVTEP